MAVAPAAFNYNDTYVADLEKYHVIVAGRAGVDARSFYPSLIKNGKRVVQYINVVDVNGFVGGSFDSRFATGAPALGVSNWGGFKVVDLSSAAWRDKLVENFKWAVSVEALTDIFLDVFGLRLWSSAWTGMTASQQAAFAAGIRDLADRFTAVRDQYRPDARLYANGTWNGVGHAGLCPVIEHHDGELPKGSGDFWWKYLNELPWDSSGQRAGFIIASTITAANAWSTVPGIGPIAAQGTYGTAPANALPYKTLAPRVVAPAPSPDPTPAPPPETDPCADVKAQLADEQTANTSLAAQVVDLTSKLAEALAKIEAAKAALA